MTATECCGILGHRSRRSNFDRLRSAWINTRVIEEIAHPVKGSPAGFTVISVVCRCAGNRLPPNQIVAPNCQHITSRSRRRPALSCVRTRSLPHPLCLLPNVRDVADVKIYFVRRYWLYSKVAFDSCRNQLYVFFQMSVMLQMMFQMSPAHICHIYLSAMPCPNYANRAITSKACLPPSHIAAPDSVTHPDCRCANGHQ